MTLPEDVPLPDMPDVPPPVTDPADSAPDCVIAGTFAIYLDGKGGYVLVTDTREHGIQRQHVPHAMVKLADKLGGVGGKLAGFLA